MVLISTDHATLVEWRSRDVNVEEEGGVLAAYHTVLRCIDPTLLRVQHWLLTIGLFFLVNLYGAEFILGNLEIYLQFLSFLNIGVTQVFEILSCGR